MESGGTKLDIIGGKKSTDNSPSATYKVIPEKDMEDEALSRPKSLVKVKTASPESDGADEKMLPKDETRVNVNSNIDATDVKISPAEKQNGDAKLDIGDLKQAFVGLTKEELMKYSNDPFWVRIRTFLFVTFWILWAGMLVGAILIIYAAPKCDPPPPKNWWEKGPLAEVPADVKIETLKAAKEQGIQGFIWPWTKDAYSEISGTDPAIQFLTDAQKAEINVIVELEPCTSEKWFAQSEANESPYNDYYLWQLPKDGSKPPNNWVSVANRSSWKSSSKRPDMYYAPLDKPHLNFRNENVTQLFSDQIKSFIQHGAAGIRLKNAAFLLVNNKFLDEPSSKTPGPYVHTDYGFYMHSKTENLPELGPLLYQWRKVVKNLTENGPLMVSEELRSVDSYKTNGALVVDLPLQSRVFSRASFNVSQTVMSLSSALDVDKIDWPLWQANSNAVSKEALDIVTFLLPGAPLVNISRNLSEPLLKLRHSSSIMRGICSVHAVANKTVLSYIRVISGNPGILVALNPTNERVTVDFPDEIQALSELKEVTIQLYSSNYNETDYMHINGKVKAFGVPISPKSVLVLSYVPKKD